MNAARHRRRSGPAAGWTAGPRLWPDRGRLCGRSSVLRRPQRWRRTCGADKLDPQTALLAGCSDQRTAATGSPLEPAERTFFLELSYALLF